MSIQFVRVVNQQLLHRSILLDKIDRSQSNFTFYAQTAKQKLYVPYRNPSDPAVKGYVDLVPTNEVLLNLRDDGVIKGLSDSGWVTYATVASNLLATPVVSGADANAGATTIDGTTFTSQLPDITYVILTNVSGISQKIPSGAFDSFSGTEIVILDAAVTIGVPASGWTAKVMANSRVSNSFAVT